jgi:DNA-binding beta-propeller fold protein YncE
MAVMDISSARQSAAKLSAAAANMGEPRNYDRRQFGRLAAGSLAALAFNGCTESAPGDGRLDKVWGEVGLGDGQFSKPRAMAIDANDELYIVDMTARVQVFDVEGRFLRGWRTPEFTTGKPTGLTIAPDGNLLVADTHYYRILTYTPSGVLLEERTLGGTLGQGPGEFGFVTDVVRDAAGNYYVSEYGEFDRIQKFSPDREFLFQWGGHGTEPGKFQRPQHLELSEEGHLWVADACNHRIQIFDQDGKLIRFWGKHGFEPGEMHYPYCLALDGAGHVYVSEFGNHRVQKFTVDGRSVACWGGEGRVPGKLYNPWALVLDSRGRVHVLDTMNHRVQRVVI